MFKGALALLGCAPQLGSIAWGATKLSSPLLYFFPAVYQDRVLHGSRVRLRSLCAALAGGSGGSGSLTRHSLVSPVSAAPYLFWVRLVRLGVTTLHTMVVHSPRLVGLPLFVCLFMFVLVLLQIWCRFRYFPHILLSLSFLVFFRSAE